jgi:signal transduction histidine kinase
MSRHLLAAAVVAAEMALLVAGHRGGLSPWGGPAYALVVSSVVVLRYRSAVGAFVAALLLAALTGGGYVLLLWAAYQAGRNVASRSGTAVIAGAAFGCLPALLAARTAGPRDFPNLVAAYAVFVVLPLLAGRYLAQHERLVAALDQHNRRLRRERDLLAGQERLRERLRIARDMHDSLGHRLSLASVQAAALEVAELPPRQREAVRRLAGAVRGAVDELHELVGALRGADATGETGGTHTAAGRPPGVDAIDALVAELRAAETQVTLRRHGEPLPLSAAAGHAAYRVVQEGLTNAAKHASGRPVTVSVGWEPDSLLLTVVNPLRCPAAAPNPPGHGLSGLAERVRAAGGFLDHRSSGDGFRLVAVLPTLAERSAELGDGRSPVAGRIRTVAVGAATAALMFIVLPAGMLLGVR